MLDLETSVVQPLIQRYARFGNEVEDTTQELRIVVWQASQRHDPSLGSSLRSYCWRAAQMRLMSMHKDRKRMKRNAIVRSLDAPVDHEATDEQTLYDLVPGEDNRGREATVDAQLLNATQMAAAELVFQGYTYEETAAKLGVTRQAVGLRMTSALETVKEDSHSAKMARKRAKARVLFKQGLTAGEVANQIAVAHRTAKKWKLEMAA